MGTIQNFLINILIVFYSFLLNELRIRFLVFNGKLRGKFSKDFPKIFMDLNEASELLNLIFAQPMMLVIGSLKISTTFYFYDLYALLKAPEISSNQIGYCLGSNFYGLCNNLILMLFLVSCNLTKSEVNKVMDVMQGKVENENFKRKIEEIKSMKIFLLQLKQIQPNFSCGFYEFDWSAILEVRKINLNLQKNQKNR